MSELRIRVGASLDASAEQVFRKLTASAAAANRMLVEQTKARNAQEMVLAKASADRQTAIQKAEIERQTMLLRNKIQQENKIRDQQIREEQKVHDHIRAMADKRLTAELAETKKVAKLKADAELTEEQRVAREAGKIREATERNRIRDIARAQIGTPWKQNDRDMPYRMGYWASRNLSPVTPMLSVASRLGHDLMRGAGIDLNMGSMVSNYVRDSKAAQELSNSAYMPNDARNSKRVDSSEIIAEAGAAASATGLSRTSAIEGLQKFVGKTGDLATGRDLLKELGILSRATGTAFEDMVDASGDVSNALGDIPNKGEHVVSVMRMIAGQGKLGAVEIKDLSTQMAKLAAAAPQFEGSAETNIGAMGALAQEARQRGGAASATQAATSVMSFLNMFSKEARLKQFQAITGSSAIGASGKIRRPEEIILESLRATGGDTMKMGKIFADSGARRIVRGFETVYKEAGGGAKGLNAVHAEFSRLTSASMGKGEIEESFKRSMGGADAQAQQFQNHLQELTDQLATKAIPALEKLQPTILKVSESFLHVTSWLAENPFAVIPAAIGASIAKAGVEQSLRVGIENVFRTVISGQAGTGPVKSFMGVSNGGAGLAGNLAATMTVAAIAATTITVGMMMVDNMLEEKSKEQKGDVEKRITAANLISELSHKSGPLTKEEVAKAKKTAAELGGNIDKYEKGPGNLEALIRGITKYAGRQGWVDDTPVKNQDKREYEAAQEARQQQIKLLEMISKSMLDSVDLMAARAMGAPEPIGPSQSPEP